MLALPVLHHAQCLQRAHNVIRVDGHFLNMRQIVYLLECVAVKPVFSKTGYKTFSDSSVFIWKTGYNRTGYNSVPKNE